MKKVKFVDLVFENCEGVWLTPEMFTGLYISGIKRDCDTNCCVGRDAEVHESLSCERFGITINRKGLECTRKLEHPPRPLRDVLRRVCNIACVDLIYSVTDDGEKADHESIYVPWYWPKDKEREHEYQFRNHHQVHTWGEDLWHPGSGEEVTIEIDKDVMTDGEGHPAEDGA